MKKLVSTDFSAENWLILGKKWSMMIATADKYGCRTLPMRNWHVIFVVSNICRENASDITYEELTLIERLVLNMRITIKTLRRTLPMRNWHKHLQGKGIPQEILLDSRTLPMRNWHLWIVIWTLGTFVRRTLPMRNWHSQGNNIYFFWKLPICRTLPMRNWHSVMTPASVVMRIRRTLPMRNWHKQFFVPVFPSCRITSDITYEELTPYSP